MHKTMKQSLIFPSIWSAMFVEQHFQNSKDSQMVLTREYGSTPCTGPVKPCIFSSNLQRKTFALQFAEELRGVTEYLGNLQRVVFLLRATLHEVESSFTFRNSSNLRPLLHSVTPLQQLATQLISSACVMRLRQAQPRNSVRECWMERSCFGQSR